MSARTIVSGATLVGRPAARVDRAEIRFAVGAAGGPHSQTWLVRSRVDRPTGSTRLFIGPSQAVRALSGLPSDRRWGVVIPGGDLHAERARVIGPRFDVGRGGVEVVPGWQVAAIVVVAPAAVNHGPSAGRSPRTTYHSPPRHGRVFQAVVACAGPDAEPLSIAAGNDAGAVCLPGAPTARVWINHVPARSDIDRLVLAADRRLGARFADPARHGFLHAITDQGLPLLIDLGAAPGT